MEVAGANGQRAFKAQLVATDPAKLRREKVRLQPGVPVTVHVTTKARTLFDYLLTPVEDFASGAFREE